MSFEHPGGSLPETAPCRYGTSRLWFRGPRRSFDAPYAAVLGGSETYGRYLRHPFVARVEEVLDFPCVNLGCINAGTDTFLNAPDVLGIAAAAQVTVIQLMGAQNLSNPCYRVHPRRNDRFLQPTPALTKLYPEIDFTEFNFNRHLLAVLHRTDPARFETLRAALRAAWLDRMRSLIAALGNPVVLLWLRYAPEGAGCAGQQLGPEPLMIDPPLVGRLRPLVRAVVEVPVARAGRSADLDGMLCGPLDQPAAAHELGPKAHHDIAARLSRTLRSLI